MRKRNHVAGAMLTVAALASLAWGGVWAHAGSRAQSGSSADAGDAFAPGGFSLGTSPSAVWDTSGNAIVVTCTHNLLPTFWLWGLLTGTPATHPVLMLPPSSDNGTPLMPCHTNLGGTATVRCYPAWTGQFVDNPAAAEPAEPNIDSIKLTMPHAGCVIHTSGPTCIITYNPAASPYTFAGTYNDNAGTLAINISTLPISVVGTGCPTTVATGSLHVTYTFNPKEHDT